MGMRIEFLLVYFLLGYVLLVGGLIGIDYVQDRLEPQSGAVVAKSYKAPKGGLIGSRGEVYRFEFPTGRRRRSCPFPKAFGSRPRSATGTTRRRRRSRRLASRGFRAPALEVRLGR